VLDYSVDNAGADAFEQSMNLIMVLNNLESMGILDNTDSIYLVVTKADMFNCPMSEYDDRAEKYVSEYYGSFKNRLIDLHNKYDFEWEVLAYSIGECTFGQLLVDYNPKTNQSLNTFPQSITNKVISHTARYQKGARGLFSN
jgi:predicted HAD superfamily hydrolase